MYKIWTLEKLDGSVDYFMNERHATVARTNDPDGKVYKLISVPKVGFSETAEYDFVKPEGVE